MIETQRILRDFSREKFEALRNNIDPEDYFPGIMGYGPEPDKASRELVGIIMERLKQDYYFLMAMENCPNLGQIEDGLAVDIQLWKIKEVVR
jgi:hypothetical protein